MTDEQITEARILSTSAHTLIPLIRDLHQVSYDKLIGSFRGGEKDNIALIAECSAYRTILEEIEYKLKRLDAHYEKENK